MQIILNGQQKHIKDNLTLLDLINDLNLDLSKVAVEVNLQIAIPDNYANLNLKEGDQIEIVHFIGGG